MTSICIKMKLHAELVFKWKVLHLDSFWNRVHSNQLRKGLHVPTPKCPNLNNTFQLCIHGLYLSHTPLYKLHFVPGSLLFSDHPYLDMQVIQIHIKHILPCTQKSNMHMVRNSILMWVLFEGGTLLRIHEKPLYRTYSYLCSKSTVYVKNNMVFENMYTKQNMHGFWVCNG